MSIFVLSDTHLSINNNKPMDVFGNRWSNYLSKIQDLWCSVVSHNDTVVIPGDISWGMSLAEAKEDLLFLDKLPGKKIIGRGNHDYWWSTKKKMQRFFEENEITTIDILHNNSYEVENFIICGSRGWFIDEKNSPKESDYEKILLREVMRIEMSIKSGKDLNKDKEILLFLHFPPVFGDYVCNEIIDVLKRYDIKRCYYGHLHGLYNIEPVIEFDGIKFIIASADFLNFKPLLILN